MKPRPLKMHGSLRLTVAEARAIIAWARPENETDGTKRAAMERGIDKLERAIKDAHKKHRRYVNDDGLRKYQDEQARIKKALGGRLPTDPIPFPGGKP